MYTYSLFQVPFFLHLVKIVNSMHTVLMIQFSPHLNWELEQVPATIYYHVFLQQYGKYWQVDLMRSKTIQQKQDKIYFSFLCLVGIEPRIFQSWAYWLAIWAITPLLYLQTWNLLWIVLVSNINFVVILPKNMIVVFFLKDKIVINIFG